MVLCLNTRGGDDDGYWRSRREDVRKSLGSDQVAPVLSARDEAAHASDCLAHRPDDQVDLIFDAVLLSDTSAVLPEINLPRRRRRGSRAAFEVAPVL